MKVPRTTLAANSASAGQGGALWSSENLTEVFLDNCTLAGNTAHAGGGTFNNVSSTASGTVEVQNTIFASNTPDNCACSGCSQRRFDHEGRVHLVQRRAERSRAASSRLQRAVRRFNDGLRCGRGAVRARRAKRLGHVLVVDHHGDDGVRPRVE